MNTLLKRSIFLWVLLTCLVSLFPALTVADSSADLILHLSCQGGGDVMIWQKHDSGELLYRFSGDQGDLSLGAGTSEATEGVRVYKFRNGDDQYWVWDGTLDSQREGTLEWYKNNVIQSQQACVKL